jgi:hypothetical protein
MMAVSLVVFKVVTLVVLWADQLVGQLVVLKV